MGKQKEKLKQKNACRTERRLYQQAPSAVII